MSKGIILVTVSKVIDKYGIKNIDIYDKVLLKFSTNKILSVLKQYKFIAEKLRGIKEVCG